MNVSVAPPLTVALLLQLGADCSLAKGIVVEGPMADTLCITHISFSSAHVVIWYKVTCHTCYLGVHGTTQMDIIVTVLVQVLHQ